VIETTHLPRSFITFSKKRKKKQRSDQVPSSGKLMAKLFVKDRRRSVQQQQEKERKKKTSWHLRNSSLYSGKFGDYNKDNITILAIGSSC
jgi:hypothetical protein